MKNDEQSGSGGRTNWPVILAGVVGGGAGVALGLLVVTLANIRGFWPGMIAVCVGGSAGTILGRLAGSILFPRPPGNGHHA